MASAYPQKRMVSSVFITLASPYRATVTPQSPLSDVCGPIATTSASGVGSCSTFPRGAPQDNTRAVMQTPPSVPSKSTPITPSQMSHSPQKQISPSLSGNSLSQATPDVPAPPPPPPPPSLLDTNLCTDIDPPLPPPPLPPPPLPILEPLKLPSVPLSQPNTHNTSSQKNPVCELQFGETLPSADHRKKSLPLSSQGLKEEDADAENKDLCGFCRKPVPFSEPAIEALNRTYHAKCFQCRQCHIPLAGQLYYNKAGIPLCEDCYQASLEQCWACGESIKDQVIRALGRAYHPPCFVCSTCNRPLGEERFAQGEVGEVYCLSDYYRKYAPLCSACQQLIVPADDGKDSYTVECLGQTFHEDCYRCETCQILLSPEPNEQGCYPLDGRVLCKPCHLSLVREGQH